MSDSRFSSIPPWETKFDERERNALEAAHATADEVMDGSSQSFILQAILRGHAARHVEAAYDHVRITTEEVPILAGQILSKTATQLTVKFALPVEGAAMALAEVGLRFDGAMGSGTSYEIFKAVTTLASAPANQEGYSQTLAAARASWFAELAETAKQANVLIDEHQDRIRSDAGAVLAARYKRRMLLVGAASKLNIPLNRTGSSTYIAMQPQSLTLENVEEAATAGGSEAGLAENIADALIETITSFGRALERSPATAARLLHEDEESIRDVLLFVLNANWQGTVTGETFLGGGKTDILLRWRDRDAFVGECKFWRGEQYFQDGVDQLLDRYTVWRATQVALILFIRDRKDISSIIEKAHASLEKHSRQVGVVRRKDIDQTTYMMQAQHDRDQLVTLTLLPIVIPTLEA